MKEYEVKSAIDMAEYHLKRAATLLHDTGDFESEELDKACTAVERALSELTQVEIE